MNDYGTPEEAQGMEIRSSLWIHSYLPITLIPSFGILRRLAKFFVLEYTEPVGLRTEFRCLSGQILVYVIVVFQIAERMKMIIREAKESDFDEIWLIFHEISAVGETYAYPRDITREEAIRVWIELPRKTYVAEEDKKICGTYYIKTNQLGGGSHVCNCGYMVSSKARGKGLATSMCEHSQKVAIELGYCHELFAEMAEDGKIR